MTRGMNIAYRVGDAVYLNVTNRCTNRCEFCIRNNGDGAYGSESLWLEREPDMDEVLSAARAMDLRGASELVFCGYGEPTFRLHLCRKVAIILRSEYPNLPVRINTNGHSTLINGEKSLQLYDGAFDTVSISLNAGTAEEYVEMCHPVYGKSAFDAIIEFAKNVKKYVHKTVFSVVGDYLSETALAKCFEIAKECGIPLRVREYIGPDT